MSFFKKLFFEIVWTSALRPIDGSNKFLGGGRPMTFSEISVRKRYWCADPFIVENDGHTYLFCEIMDRKISHGLLGFGEIIDGQVSVKPIEDLGCHMSYPCVFSVNGQWYMIPETVSRKTVELYHAEKFPYEWKKTAILLNNTSAVDTTVFFIDGQPYIFVFEPDENGTKAGLSIGFLDIESKTITGLKEVFRYNDKTGRPAGGIFSIDGRLIRPTQYSIKCYGEKIVFKEFSYNPSSGDYFEKNISILSHEDVVVSSKNWICCHTYNSCGKYEIVDLGKYKFFIGRPVCLLLKALKFGGFRNDQ